MNKTRIRVLLIEDNAGDARLIREMLAETKGTSFDVTWVTSLAAAAQRLGAATTDIVLLDLGLPESAGLDTLHRLYPQGPKVPPVVVMSGLADEDSAVQAVQEGAQDYLLKGQADSVLLVRAIRYAIERSQTQEALRRAHAGLEERVRERTAELANAIETLHEEIAERKRIEEELKRHRDHLEERVRERTAELVVAMEQADVANRAKSAFLASMTHELRTPLNAILGYAQVLRRDDAIGERQLSGLDSIQQSGERLLALVNDILDLSRIEANELELCPGPIRLPRFLRNIADSLRPRAEHKSLQFRCETSSALPSAIRADEYRLRQILLSLLDNAVKFTASGQVSLRVAFSPPTRLRFEIEDTGMGMDREQLETIFRPFEHGGGTERWTQGAGLGLSISRLMVRLMGGEIRVRSEAGKGSLFWFELDAPVIQLDAALMEEEALPSPAARIASGYQGPRKKVLIVHSGADNRAVVDLLGPLGFETFEAANGREGLERAQTLRPDLIILDIVMPVMGGLDATRRLRQLPALKQVPVIAVSTAANMDEREKSLAAGANAVVAKPIDMSGLLIKIGTLLRLTWTYRQPKKEAAAQADLTGPLVIPPREDMEILHRMAMTGNMRDIRQWAAQLEAVDQQYGPFAHKLHYLAKGYQSKAILGLVEEYMQRSPVP